MATVKKGLLQTTCVRCSLNKNCKCNLSLRVPEAKQTGYKVQFKWSAHNYVVGMMKMQDKQPECNS